MKTINWKNCTLSKLCLGTVQFGLDYGVANTSGQISQDEANSIMEFSLSKSINCLDTAKDYGNSEDVIGNFLQNKKNEDINIVSKTKSEIFNLSLNNAIDEIKLSLQNLSINSLFGILLHDSEALYKWKGEQSDLVKKLKELSLIKNFGVSIYNDEEFNFALNNADIELIQIPFNLFDQRAITKDWLKKAKEKNKLIFIRSIYLQGLILMDIDKIPQHLNDAKKYVERIDSICYKLHISKNELALSFVDGIAKDSIILFGCDSLGQAKENIENYNNLIELDQDSLDEIVNNLSNINENIYNPSKWIKR